MNLEIHYTDGWAALYKDGELVPDTVGDSYVAEEKAFELCGVKQVHDNAFMRGQSQCDGVARTLDEVAEYKRQRDDRIAEAARMRAEAKALMAQADSLDPEARTG